MSRHNCLGQTVQENNVGNWESAGNSVKCQDVTDSQGRNPSRWYSAPLLHEALGQLQSLQLAGVLFQTLPQSKRFVWEAVPTRRNTLCSVTLIFSSSMLLLECFQVTAHLDFSWELRGVFPWPDEQKCIQWLELSLQEQQTQSSPAAWAVRVMGSCVCECYIFWFEINMKRLRYSLCRDFWVNDSTIWFFCPLFWGDASWNCHLTQDQIISWDVSSREVLTCPKLGS